MNKLAICFSAVMLLFSLVGCSDDDSSTGAVDFTSYANSSLKVKNTSTTVDIVVFNGSLTAENIIGGVRGGQTQGLNPAKFTLKELYVLNSVSLADYQKNSGNLSACKITTSQMVYVDTDAITVDMSGTGTGNAEVYVNNTTKYYVEVRTGNFMGATFLVARPYENMSKFVEDGEYSLYPTVVVPIKSAGVITGTRRIEDPAKIKYYGCYAEDPRNVITFTDAGITALKPSSSVVKVYNALVDAGGIYFQIGTEQQSSTLGRRIVNEGKTATYEFKGDQDESSANPYKIIENFNYLLPSGAVAIPTAGNCTRFTNGSGYLVTIRAAGASTVEYTGVLPLE